MALADKMITVEDLKAVYDKYKTGLEVWQDVTGLTWEKAPAISSDGTITYLSSGNYAKMARVSVSQGQEYTIFSLGIDSGTGMSYGTASGTYYEYPAIVSKLSNLATNSENIFYKYKSDTNQCFSGYTYSGSYQSAVFFIYKTEIVIPSGYSYMFVFDQDPDNLPAIIRKRIR